MSRAITTPSRGQRWRFEGWIRRCLSETSRENSRLLTIWEDVHHIDESLIADCFNLIEVAALPHDISDIWELLSWMNLFLWFKTIYCSIATNYYRQFNKCQNTWFFIPRIFFLFRFFFSSLFEVFVTRTSSRATTLDTLYNPVPFAILNVPGHWCTCDVPWAEADTGVTSSEELRCRGQLSATGGWPSQCHLATAAAYAGAECSTSQSQSQRVCSSATNHKYNVDTLRNFFLTFNICSCRMVFVS